MIRMKSSRISPHRTWHGVRMRRTEASPDPDSAPRCVTLPASWEDPAAAALAALGPGKGPVDLGRRGAGLDRADRGCRDGCRA